MWDVENAHVPQCFIATSCACYLHYQEYTVEQVLIAWFNDCILDKPGQIVNPSIAIVDPYHNIVYAHTYVCESINCKHRKNSQFIDTCN